MDMTEFGHTNFPAHKDPANGESGVAELYPERMQDQVNNYYTHDKAMPRIEGKDYVGGKGEY
jgi:hypothetical protein